MCLSEQACLLVLMSHWQSINHAQDSTCNAAEGMLEHCFGVCSAEPLIKLIHDETKLSFRTAQQAQQAL